MTGIKVMCRLYRYRFYIRWESQGGMSLANHLPLFLRHVSKMLEHLAAQGTNISSDTSERIKGGGGVTFYEPSTRKYLMGVSAPGPKDLLPWLKSHPSYHILVPVGKGRH